MLFFSSSRPNWKILGLLCSTQALIAFPFPGPFLGPSYLVGCEQAEAAHAALPNPAARPSRHPAAPLTSWALRTVVNTLLFAICSKKKLLSLPTLTSGTHEPNYSSHCPFPRSSCAAAPVHKWLWPVAQRQARRAAGPSRSVPISAARGARPPLSPSAKAAHPNRCPQLSPASRRRALAATRGGWRRPAASPPAPCSSCPPCG